jgi:hypothetical protein
MRGLGSTIVLILVLVGLGAYIYFVDSKQPAGALGPAGVTMDVKTKVFTVEADKIDEIRITAEKETSLVKKVNGTWQMVEPAQSEADQTESSGLATSIAGVEVSRVVEENATDLATYGLADPRFKVAFKGADGAAGELHIGERTATQSDLYAVKAGEKRVFLVPSFQETSFNKKPFDLRDKRILTIKRDDIDSLEISGETRLQLARTGTEWNVRRPVEARGDYSAIEGVLTRIASANMTKIVEQAPPGGSIAPDVLTKYGLDKPSLTVTVSAGSTKAGLAIGKEEDGTLYARDLSRPMVFAVDPTLATDLKKPADEYRNKNVFEFRPFNLARLRVTRGPDTYEFQKVGATPAAQGDKWQRTVNGGAAADVDSTKMDDLLSKLTNLRIVSFVLSSTAKPEVIVAASYSEGKFERVRFGKAGTDVFATREADPGAGRLDAANYDETIKALDAVVK